MSIEVSWHLEGVAATFLDIVCSIAMVGLDEILTTAAPEVAAADWAYCSGTCCLIVSDSVLVALRKVRDSIW